MNKEEIIRKVKELRLPVGEYIVFGSGPLAANGIRETQDIDMLLSKDLYQTLKKSGWEEKLWSSGDKYLSYKEVEAGNEWRYGDYRPTLEKLLASADYFDGVPFVNLEEVLKRKIAFGREKDLIDVKLIKEHLKRIARK